MATLPIVNAIPYPKQANPRRRLKVLVLDEYLPYPPNSGKPIRTWNLLKRMATRHDVTLLCYADKTDAYLPNVRGAGLHVHTVPSLPNTTGLKLYAQLAASAFSPNPFSVDRHVTTRFSTELSCLLNSQRFDLVHCEWTPYAAYLQTEASTPYFVATHNVESQILERRAETYSRAFARWFFRNQARKMATFEQRVLARAQHVSTVTELDRQTIIRWVRSDVSLVENGVDLAWFTPSAQSTRDLLFIGSLDWQPNVDAIEFFLKAIFPTILSERPQIRFVVVGKGPSPRLHRLLRSVSGVKFVGEVSDPRPHFASAAVVVVPLRIGGGSRIKILESLAMGKAVVSTSVGAEGLSIQPGIHCIVADEPHLFSRQVLHLLASEEQRLRLGQA